METLQALTLILALISQLYVYCWFGNEITEQVRVFTRTGTTDLVLAYLTTWLIHIYIYRQKARKKRK